VADVKLNRYFHLFEHIADGSVVTDISYPNQNNPVVAAHPPPLSRASGELGASSLSSLDLAAMPRIRFRWAFARRCVGLRAPGLGPGAVNVLARQIELVFVAVVGPATFCPAVGEHALHRDAVFLVERHHPVDQSAL
jgi:hypothetical protein